jgi:hypothetical protein
MSIWNAPRTPPGYVQLEIYGPNKTIIPTGPDYTSDHERRILDLEKKIAKLEAVLSNKGGE